MGMVLAEIVRVEVFRIECEHFRSWKMGKEKGRCRNLEEM